MTFDKLIGNDKIKDILKNIIENNNILHSYLFIGIDGIGKSEFAREFARQILCIGDNKQKCNLCKSCVSFENDNNPDFMEIFPEDGKSIKIEQIRQVQEKILEKPIVSNRKVYIIHDCDCMTKEASNCLLKTLEEPQEYVTIILTTSNESKLLNTIKSRCIKIIFDEIPLNELNKYIKDKYGNINTETISKMSQGSIGKAIEIKEHEEEYIKLNNIIDNLYTKDIIDVLNSSEVLYKSKENINKLLDYMIVLIYNGTKEINKINSIKHIEEAKKRLNANSNYDMCIDNLLISMWEEIHEKYSWC